MTRCFREAAKGKGKEKIAEKSAGNIEKYSNLKKIVYRAVKL